MPRAWFAPLIAAVALLPARGYAQTSARPMSPLQTAVACAAPMSTDLPKDPVLRIVGTQDATSRELFGPRDLLVIGGGTGAGLQLGQQFFVRRVSRFGSASDAGWQAIRTLGWIRIVAVNASTAMASVDYACDGMVRSDYLEPFTVPAIPAGAESDMTTGEPDFGAIGRVLGGSEDRQTAGSRDLIVIDRGSDSGVKPGDRYAVYRDVGVGGMPLASVGEAVVITVGKEMALARVTRSRDAIVMGDVVAPRK